MRVKDEIKEEFKSEKKTRILDAAAVLFSRKQYHEVMIQDVANLASIAKGTVYNYFNSKEDIYFSIMLERMDKLINSLDQKIKEGNDSKQALESYILHLYMFMMKYQDFFLMYRKETLKAENELCSNIATMQSQLRQMLIEIIVNGIRGKIFRIIEPVFAADLIIGSIYASVSRGIEKNYGEADMVRERTETFNFIYDGMSSRNNELPLSNRKIVLTRTEEQNEESRPLFESAGATVISIPMLKVARLDSAELLKEHVLSEPDYVVFTSANAVNIFNEILTEFGLQLKNAEIAAVGPKTAEACSLAGYTPGIIPLQNNAEGLIEYFRTIDLSGKKILIPRSAIGRMELIEYFKTVNAEVLPLDIYTVIPPDYEDIKTVFEDVYNNSADIIVFSSPSAVTNFLRLTGEKGIQFLRWTRIASIGSTTTGEIQKAGFYVNIQPDDFTMEALRNSVIDFIQRRESEI